MAMLKRVNQAYSLRLQKLTKQITVASLTAAATSQAIAFGSDLPADAQIHSAKIDITTPFSGGGAANATADVGENGGDTDGYIDGANVFTGAASPASAPRGVLVPGQAASVTPVVTIASNVNVNTLTAGDILVTVYYFRTGQA